MTCSSPVYANQVNRLKLAIADTSDRIYDAAVFVKGGSITVERRPVILVPGMTASFNAACFLRDEGCADQSKWGWTGGDFLAAPVYAALLEKLDDLGYTQASRFATVFYYDWRGDIGVNGDRLDTFVEQIKAATGATQVDLIAHSMGGLVARAYVQSADYDDDVAHLVTLGTPHAGSAKAYPVWQAADFRYQGPERVAFEALLAYYRRLDAPVPVDPLWDYINRVKTLRRFFPSVQQILPTGDYLLDAQSGAVLPESQMIWRNSYLPQLNSGISDLVAATEVATFAGVYTDTVARYYVRPRGPLDFYNWDDGVPEWSLERQPAPGFYDPAGDETVLVSSALLSQATTQQFVDVSHVAIAGDLDAINEALRFLGISVATPTKERPRVRPMVVVVTGPVEVHLVGPSGALLVDTEARPVGETMGAHVVETVGTPVRASFVFFSPDQTGQYRVQVVGDGVGPFGMTLVDGVDYAGEEPIPGIPYGVFELNSQSQPGMEVTFAFTFTTGMTETIDVRAETPVIEWPLFADAAFVRGRSTPGATVIIRDVTTGDLVASGPASTAGTFALQPVSALRMGQRLSARVDAVDGPVVEVQPRRLWLPSVQR